MEDMEIIEGSTKDAPKIKRPGRDKESRMRDLSEEESSGDSDIPLLEKEEIPVKSYSSPEVANEKIESKVDKDCLLNKSDNKQRKEGLSKEKRRHSSESSSSVELVSIQKSRDRKGNKSHIETGKIKKADKLGSHDWKECKLSENIKDSSECRSSSESSDNSSQTGESKHESRLKAKKIKEAIIKRIFAKKKDSLMVSIERKKYESSSKVDESQKRHSSDFESNDSSPKESNNQSTEDGNETSKGGIKVQNKDHDSHSKADVERAYKSVKNSDSSDNSSDSERSRYRKRGRKVEKTKPKEKLVKRMPSKGSKKKGVKKHHGVRKHKKRGSSVSSSSSSSSSKSMSDSSSSSSGTSSSSSTSQTSSKTSVSKERSPSSSSTTSSSSVRRHKRKFKNKDNNKHRSRSPLKIRKKSNQPPRPKKIHVGHLTKNVNKSHLYEIFSLYGVVKNVDLPIDKYRSNGFTPRGFAYVEYDKADDAEKALQNMNGGIIDGQKIKVAPVIPFKPRLPMRRNSPNRRPFGNWHYTPPFRNRGGALMNMGSRDRRRRMRSPPRRRSPRRRTRSRSPIRRRRMRRTSHSSSR